MLAFIGLIMNIVAVVRFYIQSSDLFTIGLIVGVMSLWSYGVIQNFRNDPHNLPTFWAVISFITTIAGAILLILSFVN
jgi:hypothetical protein